MPSLRHSSILGLVFLASVLGSPVAHAAFSDVDATHANFRAILSLQEEGIVEGYADGTFRPDRTINRAEFVKILLGKYTTPISEYDLTNRECDQFDGLPYIQFSDIPRTAWYARFFCTDINGALEGYPDGTFKPGEPINFVEAAKLINFSAGWMPVTEPWYRGYVENMGDTKAIPPTITGFEHRITRGEMAEMMFRFKEAHRPDWISHTYESLLKGLPADSSLFDWKEGMHEIGIGYTNVEVPQDWSLQGQWMTQEGPQYAMPIGTSDGTHLMAYFGMGALDDRKALYKKTDAIRETRDFDGKTYETYTMDIPCNATHGEANDFCDRPFMDVIIPIQKFDTVILSYPVDSSISERLYDHIVASVETED